MQGKGYNPLKLCVSFRGYNRHCGVVVSARNRKGMEELCPLHSTTTTCKRPFYNGIGTTMSPDGPSDLLRP